MELASSKIKKFLIFLEMELSSLIFFSYFRNEHSGNGTLSPSLKNSYISGGNFKVSSLKKFLIFFSYFFKSF